MMLTTEGERPSCDEILRHKFLNLAETYTVPKLETSNLMQYIVPPPAEEPQIDMPRFDLLKRDKTHTDIIVEADNEEEEESVMNLDEIPVKD
jgi:hypothetical protein